MNFGTFNLGSMIYDDIEIPPQYLMITAIVGYSYLAGIPSQTGLTEYTSMLVRPRSMAVTLMCLVFIRGGP
ncbi:hypothetical protein DIRU0_D02894 [Diutina rugosa]